MIARIMLALALVVAPAAARAELREGKRFTVLVEGEGPDVVLIPGLSSPRGVWAAQRKALAARHRLHLVQIRGFGDDPGPNASGPILDPLSRELADYIDDEIVDRGAKPPAVIGHSLGGLIGMKIAAEHPALVGRLMVVDALPFIGTLFAGPGATAATIEPQAARTRDAMAAAPRSTPVSADPGGIWSNTPAGRIAVANWAATADPRVAAQAMYEDMVMDLRPMLGRIVARPFTVLYATGAGPQAKAIWERDYAGSPATLVPVAASWHFIMLDQPAAFAAALDEFLAR